MALITNCTVIINVKNGEKTIEKAIDSALMQSIRPKVMIIDNQSDDKTFELCNKKEIYYLKTPHSMTLAEARNFGLKNLEKDCNFFCFLDADDYYHKKNSLEKIISCFEKKTASVFGQAKVINKYGKFIKKFTKKKKKKYFFNDLVKRYEICWSAQCFNYEMVRGINFDESLNICEDLDFNLKVSKIGDILYFDKVVSIFLVSEDSNLLNNLDLYFKELKQIKNNYSISIFRSIFLFSPYFKNILKKYLHI